MEKVSLTQEQLKAINGYHVRIIDKWYRMLYGISSKLTNVKDGVASLRININPRWKKSNKETALHFIKNWRNAHEEFKDIDSWNVQVFLVQNIAGYIVHMDEVNTEKTRKLIDLMNADPKPQLIFELEALDAGDNEFIIFCKNSEDTMWDISISTEL